MVLEVDLMVPLLRCGQAALEVLNQVLRAGIRDKHIFITDLHVSTGLEVLLHVVLEVVESSLTFSHCAGYSVIVYAQHFRNQCNECGNLLTATA